MRSIPKSHSHSEHKVRGISEILHSLRSFRMMGIILCLYFFSTQALYGADYHQAQKKALQWLSHQIVPNAIIPKPFPSRRGLILSFEMGRETREQRAFDDSYLRYRSWSYDNALAIIAFTMSGEYAQAEKIIQVLDDLTDYGMPLWFSYNTHDSWPFGSKKEGIARNGANAWVGYALCFYLLWRNEQDPLFLKSDRGKKKLLLAERIAKNIFEFQITDTQDPRKGLFKGGIGSVRYVIQKDKTVREEHHSAPIVWVSTEHQIGIYFFFKNLARLIDPDVRQRYLDSVSRIKFLLLKKLWNSTTGQFNRGLSATAVDTTQALDCASWGGLFLQSVGKSQQATVALKRTNRYLVHDAQKKIKGHKPYFEGWIYEENQALSQLFFPPTLGGRWENLNLFWQEGTLGVAALLVREDHKSEALMWFEQILHFQTDSGGIRYAYPEVPFEFSSFPSVAATAWYVIVINLLENERARRLFWN